MASLTTDEFRAAMAADYPGVDVSDGVYADSVIAAAIETGLGLHSATRRGLMLATAHALVLWADNASNPLGGGAASGDVASVRVGDIQTNYNVTGSSGFSGGGGDRAEYLKRSVYGQTLLALEARRGVVAAYAV